MGEAVEMAEKGEEVAVWAERAEGGAVEVVMLVMAVHEGHS